MLTPLDASRAPREVQPMTAALNDLMHRVAGALEIERRFSANAAHELRTPLAAMQAHLHAARAATHSPQCGYSLDQLQTSLNRGIRMVEQLLMLARLDPEQALPDSSPVDIKQTAEAVCADLAPRALQQEQTLELHAEAPLPPVAGNADLLAVLISNLIDNAIRYTPRGGRIDVILGTADQSVVVTVADDGPGIPAAQRELVFERFYRLNRNDQPGTGLGLAICRRIVELHHARIDLADQNTGHGLVASVLLPAMTLPTTPNDQLPNPS
jgi:two-component system sensor histidine kinase QseC